ncbi:MAG: ABC transporter ATP-binding protein [Oscillospiraceae bacterium]|nr:ABC transporter ATP-binding protein [Oscillospiraceae bacterium]
MRRVLKEMKPFWLSIVLISVFTIFHVIAELGMPSLMSNIIDVGIVNSDGGYVLAQGGVMLALAVFGLLSTAATGYFSAKMSAGVGRNLRSALFAKVESFSLADVDRFGTASLIIRTTNDVTQLQNFVVMFFRIVLMSPFMMIGSVFMALSNSQRLSGIILAAMVFLIVLVTLIARTVMPLTQAMQQKLDALNRVLREKLNGLRVIRAFNTEEHERLRFDGANRDLSATSLKMQRIMTLLMPGMMFLLNATTILILWFGSGWVSAGELMVGDLVAVLQYVMHIMMSLMMMSMVVVMLPRALTSANRVGEVLEHENSILDPQAPSFGGQKDGTVEFQDVSFSYGDSDDAVLDHISFTARPGETTAIIGSTGSGKTTLLNLIPRFYETSEGRVLVDGVDVREYRQEDLRKKIGYVPQKSVLFSGTIADNIRFGREDADGEQLRKAAEISQSFSFIEEKAEGFESHIAQGGSNVSGGQKQRLSIARAVAKRPEIYLFDDSFSALDLKTDADLRRALAQETGGATVILVAQRVSTIMHAQQILVLDEGRIAGKGTHQELLESCGVYREIVFSQLSENEITKGGK